MPKHVVFLYLGSQEKIDQLYQSGIEGLVMRSGTSLVGVNTDIITKADRDRLVHEYGLREFEVDQEKFHVIIEKLGVLGAKLTNLEFFDSYLDEETFDEFTYAMENQEIEALLRIIKERWNEGNDLRALEYFLNGYRIRYTSLAELDVSAASPNLQEVLNTYPIGVLSGVVREDRI